MNGDWQCATEVQHFAPTGGGSTARDAVADEECLPILLPHLLHLFPRHPWTGANITFREAGLLCVVHGFLLIVGRVWLQCARETRRPQAKDF